MQWLLDETGSAVLVGFIGVVQLVVQIPALLWGGALAHRIDRKGLMTLANATTCLAMLAMLVLGTLNGADLPTPPWFMWVSHSLPRRKYSPTPHVRPWCRLSYRHDT